MTNHNQTIVKPEIQYLTDILDNISSGTLRVPNFQRPFVWKPEDMTALFESILDGYPIGSLLFWRANERYNSLPRIGPNILRGHNNLPVNYILDGHQRLSTLYGVLANIKKSFDLKNELKDDNWKWVIFYDLKDEEFLHIRKDEEIKPHYINLRYIVGTTDFLKESQRIINECKKDGEIFVEKAEKLNKAIRSYRIAITQIDGGDLESAVNIFARLNTKGQQMSIDRMYSALTYKEGSFNLSDRIDEIKGKLSEFNFSSIDRVTIFRVILAASGKNIYTKGKYDLFKDEMDRLPSILEECEQSILKTAEFLNKRLKVPSDNFLPHSLQFLILSEFFRLSQKYTDAKLEKIEQWFWVTSFVGIEQVNSSKKKQTLEEIRNFAKLSEKEAIKKFQFKIVDFEDEAREFPSRFDLNSARVRAFVLFLKSLEPLSIIEKNSINTNLLLSKYGYKALGYITKNKNKLRSSPANRVIINPRYNTKDIKRYVKELNTKNTSKNIENRDGILKSNVLNEENIQLLIDRREDDFLERREQQLIELEKEFMKSKGVKPFNSEKEISGLDFL